MSKFLQLCEEHDPSNTNKMDAAFQAKFFFYEEEIPFSSNGTQITIHTEHGDIVMEVMSIQPRGEVADAEEDESVNASAGDYSVGDEVEKLANKAASGVMGMAGRAMGSKAQKAKSAVKEREKLAGKAVDAYRKGTDRLKKGLQAVKTSAANRTY